MDQSRNTQLQQKVQLVKDQRIDEENKMSSVQRMQLYQLKIHRNVGYRIRLDCDEPLGEARVSVFGLDYKEI